MVIWSMMIYWLVLSLFPSFAGEPQILHQRTVNFSTVVFFPLKELGIPNAEYLLSLLQGTVEDLVLVDGEIRFWAGPDLGEDQTLLLSLAGEQNTYHLPVLLKSLRPIKEIILQSPAATGETAAEHPAAAMKLLSGIGPGNQLQLAPWSWQWQGPLGENAKFQRWELYHVPSHTTLRLADVTGLQDGVGGLSVKEVQNWWQKIPPGEALLTATIFDHEEQILAQYQLNVFKAQAKLHGKIVDKSGNSSTQLAQRKIGIRGLNNRVSTVVAISPDGTFEVENLVPGLYDVTLLDVQHPGAVSTTVEIFPTDQAQEVILLAPPMLATMAPPGQTAAALPNATPTSLSPP